MGGPPSATASSHLSAAHFSHLPHGSPLQSLAPWLLTSTLQPLPSLIPLVPVSSHLITTSGSARERLASSSTPFSSFMLRSYCTQAQEQEETDLVSTAMHMADANVGATFRLSAAAVEQHAATAAPKAAPVLRVTITCSAACLPPDHSGLVPAPRSWLMGQERSWDPQGLLPQSPGPAASHCSAGSASWLLGQRAASLGPTHPQHPLLHPPRAWQPAVARLHRLRQSQGRRRPAALLPPAAQRPRATAPAAARAPQCPSGCCCAPAPPLPLRPPPELPAAQQLPACRLPQAPQRQLAPACCPVQPLG